MSARGFELGTDGPGVVVVGVDGSDTSMRAAAYGVGIVRRQGARLVVVYARRHPGGLETLADPGMALAVVQQTQDEIEASLRAALAAAVDAGVRAQLVVRGGDPFTVLRDVADEVRADSVVVGASMSLGHRITGSLAVRLVRCGRWPVTVVP